MTTSNETPIAFQVLSRNNDRNGNPFRLMIVYGQEGGIVEAYEARSSMPNHRKVLRNRGLIELVDFHLVAKEYNTMKDCCKAILQHVS